MVGSHWFVYPVDNGIELVIDSTDGDVYDHALAEFVVQFSDYELVAEWTMDGGEVLRFVAAPIDAPAEQPAASEGPVQQPAAPRSAEEADAA